MRSELLRYLHDHGWPDWVVPDFGLMLTAAIIAGSILTLHLWHRRAGENRTASDLIFWGIPGLLVGAKLFYFLQFGFPSTLSGWFSGRGLALYGGLFGLAVVWSVCYRIRPFDAATFLDCAAPALGLGLFLGRIGCFLAGCNGGIPSGLPWAVQFPKGTAVFFHQVEAGLRPAWASRSAPVHPTQLYGSLFGLIAMGLLLVLLRSETLPPGCVFWTAMLWYALYRFATEPLRSDAGGLHPFGLLTFSQTVSLLLALAAAGLILHALMVARRSGRSGPRAFVVPAGSV